MGSSIPPHPLHVMDGHFHPYLPRADNMGNGFNVHSHDRIKDEIEWEAKQLRRKKESLTKGDEFNFFEMFHQKQTTFDQRDPITKYHFPFFSILPG